jgi:hypothetical protein
MIRRLGIITALLVTGSSIAGAVSQPAQAAVRPAQCGTTAAGWRVQTGPNTSCPFARSVYGAVTRWERAHGGLWNDDVFFVRAYSPVTGSTYRMRVFVSVGSDGKVVVGASGARNAFVLFWRRS